MQSDVKEQKREVSDVEHLHRAREMVTILENRDIYVRAIKCRRPGYVLYEDEAQVLAYPFADVRRRL